MTLYADDPDVHVVFPVTDREGQNITISPATVMVDGFSDITATWLGDPAPVRNLKVPLYGLPPMVELKLRLVVPGDNDVPLTAKTGGVILRSSSADWEWPGQPGGTDLGSIGSALTISAPGSYEFDLTVNATVTVSTSGDVTLWAHGTGQTLTVAGQTFTIEDGAVILIVTSPREVQSAYLAGGGSGVVDPGEPEDTTPPSAVTGLSATGGEGQVTFNWTAVTDAESTVGYRYRVWPTSGGATGEYVTRSSVGPVTVTGLAAGGYTVQVYAYSNGGSSAVASATATVTAVPGWSTLISDAFTGSDGTLGGHVPNVTPDNAAWATGSSPDFVAIASNKITHNATGYNPAATLLIPTQTAGIGVALDVVLATQPDTSTPALGISLKSPDNGDDLSLTIFMAAGALSIELSQGNGLGNVTLTGTTTGLPLTGRYAMRWRQSDKSVSILRDGTQIATGTTSNPSYSRDFKQVRLSMSGYKSSTVDNFVIESYT